MEYCFSPVCPRPQELTAFFGPNPYRIMIDRFGRPGSLVSMGVIGFGWPSDCLPGANPGRQIVIFDQSLPALARLKFLSLQGGEEEDFDYLQ